MCAATFTLSSENARVVPISSGYTGAPTTRRRRAISAAGSSCFPRRALISGQRVFATMSWARRPSLSRYFAFVVVTPTSGNGVPAKSFRATASSAGQSGHAATQASTSSRV